MNVSITSICLGVLLLILLTCLFAMMVTHAVRSQKTAWGAAAFVCGLGIFLLIGAAVAFFPSSLPRGNHTAVFYTRDGLASLSSPAGDWEELSLPVPDAVLTLGNDQQEEYLAVIAQPKSDFEKGFTVRNYAAAAAEIFSGDDQQFKATEMTDFSLNGLSAIRIEVSGKLGPAQTEYINTFVEGERHFYQIRCWTSLNQRAVSVPRLKKAVATFHELAGQSPPRK